MCRDCKIQAPARERVAHSGAGCASAAALVWAVPRQIAPDRTGTDPAGIAAARNPMTLTQSATVGDVMTRKIVTVSEQDALDMADDGMHRMRFRHLPVVDDRGRLVGIL